MPAKIRMKNVRKRTSRPFAPCTADRGSRFVPCPLCGANVPWHNINEHLDTVHTDSHPSSDLKSATSEQPIRAELSQLDPKVKLRNTGSDLQVHKSTAAGAVQISHTVSQIKYDTGGSSAPQPWWQQATMPQMLASAKFTGRPRQSLPLTDEQLRSLAPCEVVRNALPLKLANSLLWVLLADCETWVRGTWFMAGKQHSAPRRSAYYTLGSTQDVESFRGSSREALDVSSSVTTRAAPADLQEAAALVSEHVNQLIPRVCNQLAADDREKWHSSYALCNIYQDGQEGVGAHADRLTMLGPRPVIASLSLGATRTFRLRSMAAQDMQSHAAKQQQEHSLAASPSQSQHLHCTASHESALGSSAHPNNQVNKGSQVQQQQDKRIPNAAQAIGYGTSAQPAMQPGGVCAIAQHSRVTTAQPSHEAGCVSSIDVVLPHNTLVIMWPPMQEAWKHEIPKCKQVIGHPVAGKARINLTFRQLKPSWAERAPCCRCGQKAVMKASLPSSAVQEQQYYYSCDNTKGPGCGFYLKAQVTS